VHAFGRVRREAKGQLQGVLERYLAAGREAERAGGNVSQLWTQIEAALRQGGSSIRDAVRRLLEIQAQSEPDRFPAINRFKPDLERRTRIQADEVLFEGERFLQEARTLVQQANASAEQLEYEAAIETLEEAIERYGQALRSFDVGLELSPGRRQLQSARTRAQGGHEAAQVQVVELNDKILAQEEAAERVAKDQRLADRRAALEAKHAARRAQESTRESAGEEPVSVAEPAPKTPEQELNELLQDLSQVGQFDREDVALVWLLLTEQSASDDQKIYRALKARLVQWIKQDRRRAAAFLSATGLEELDAEESGVLAELLQESKDLRGVLERDRAILVAVVRLRATLDRQGQASSLFGQVLMNIFERSPAQLHDLLQQPPEALPGLQSEMIGFALRGRPSREVLEMLLTSQRDAFLDFLEQEPAAIEDVLRALEAHIAVTFRADDALTRAANDALFAWLRKDPIPRAQRLLVPRITEAESLQVAIVPAFFRLFMEVEGSLPQLVTVLAHTQTEEAREAVRTLARVYILTLLYGRDES